MKNNVLVHPELQTKMVIVVRKDLGMRKGKMIAQGAHASLKFLLENNESVTNNQLTVRLSKQVQEWLRSGQTKICCSVDSGEELLNLVALAKANNVEVHDIIDAGRTEFHGEPTLTCAAFGPADSELIDEITGHLKLL